MPDGIRGEDGGAEVKRVERGPSDDGGNKGEKQMEKRRREEMNGRRGLGRADRHARNRSPRSLLSLGFHGRVKPETVSTRAIKQESNKVFQPQTLR